MSNGSRHSVFAIKETDYGVTPTAASPVPEYGKVRYNTCTLGIDRDSLQSAEIRSDRQIVDFRSGQNKVGGNITGEVSLDPMFLDFLASVLGGSWDDASKSVKAGILRNSYTFLRHFEDMVSPAKAWMIIPGIEFSTFSLSVEPGKIATYTLETIGQGYTPSATPPASAVFNSSSTNSPMDAFTGTINEGGSPIATVTKLDLKLDNALNRRFVIGNRNTIRPDEGRSNLTGSMTTYFDNTALLEKFLGDTNSKLSFTLTAGSDTLTFNLPNIKYTSGKQDVTAEGAVSMPMNFQAIYSPADATQIIVTRS